MEISKQPQALQAKTNINHFIEREGQTKGPFSFEQLLCSKWDIAP